MLVVLLLLLLFANFVTGLWPGVGFCAHPNRLRSFSCWIFFFNEYPECNRFLLFPDRC